MLIESATTSAPHVDHQAARPGEDDIAVVNDVLLGHSAAPVGANASFCSKLRDLDDRKDVSPRRRVLLKSQAIQKIGYGVQGRDSPSPWNWPQLGVLEVAREKIDPVGRHTDRRLAVALRDYRIEVYEPGLEDARCERLDVSVHPSVQLDLVIHRRKRRCDCSLTGWRRKRDSKAPLICQAEVRSHIGRRLHTFELFN